MQQNSSSINRRKFIQVSGITGVGLVLGLSVRGNNGLTEVLNLANTSSSFELTPFVIIEKSGAITIFNTRPELGQGTFQSIPALIAEELEVSMDKITIKQTGGEKQFGNRHIPPVNAMAT